MVWLLFGVASAIVGYLLANYLLGDLATGVAFGGDAHRLEFRDFVAVVGFFVGSWLYTATDKFVHWTRTHRGAAEDSEQDEFDDGSTQRLSEVENKLSYKANLTEEGWRVVFMWWRGGQPRKIRSNLELRYVPIDMSGIGSVSQLTSKIEELYDHQLTRRGRFFVVVQDRRNRVLHGNTDLP